MCACPFKAKGYVPAAEGERQEQQVLLGGAERWTGRICPGAVVTEDPFVAAMLRTYWPHEQWGHLPDERSWGQMPAWWTAGILDMKGLLSAIEAERLKPSGSIT